MHVAIAAALGAAAMYALDPVSGRRRRALARDQLRGRWNDAGDYARRKARHLRNRAEGLAAGTSSTVEAAGRAFTPAAR
jgi:hypothetical protein